MHAHITAIQHTANRIRDAKKEGMKVIDVDGSYVARKHQQLQADGVNVAPLGVPPIPPSGWNAVSETNFKDAVEKMPKMMSGNNKKNCFRCTYYHHFLTFSSGTLYSYLAEGVGRSKGEGAFRALSRGYTHWASGRMEELEINMHNPNFCHVRCLMKPSMKSGKYKVYCLLRRDGDFATIASVTCECAAGYGYNYYTFSSCYRKSVTCTHVSALLHALVAMTPTHLKPGPSRCDVDEDLPVTSYPCQWKEPRKRKQSNLNISDAKVEKHMQRKLNLLPLEEFDPRLHVSTSTVGLLPLS